MEGSDEEVSKYRNVPIKWFGWWQTVLGSLGLPLKDPPSKEVLLTLEGGDRLSCWDSVPPSWKNGDLIVILVHGMAGSYRSRYIVRLARALYSKGTRVFRVNLRGCGTGAGIARLPTNAGASEEPLAAIQYVKKVAPDSILRIVGFSMGGNIVLKMLGEQGWRIVDKAVVVCPGVDPMDCCLHLEKKGMQLILKSYLKALFRQVRKTPGAPKLDTRNIKTLMQFDTVYTSAELGFENVQAYYEHSRAGNYIERIVVPTVILYAKDDPVAGYRSIEELACPECVTRVRTEHGGHMGFLSCSLTHFRWMDNFIVSQVLG